MLRRLLSSLLGGRRRRTTTTRSSPKAQVAKGVAKTVSKKL